MNVPNELVYNFIVGLKKKEIHPVDKAQLIRTYMEESKLTIKQLSLETGVPTATLHDYLNYNKIDKITYANLLGTGSTKTQIFKTLRNSNYKNKEQEVMLNEIIKDTSIKLRSYINNPVYNEKTIELIRNLKNTLNRIELHIERTTR